MIQTTVQPHNQQVSRGPAQEPRVTRHMLDGRVRPPRILSVNTGFREAMEMAVQDVAPVFVPVSLHADDRGWSMMNMLAGVLSPQGQVNYSVQYPGIVKAWHRHAKQTDFWICVGGHIKAGVFREHDNSGWMLVFGEKRPGVLIIPPLLWHGAACVGHQPAGLLYYVTHAYDAQQPDEQRQAWDAVEEFPWQPQNG